MALAGAGLLLTSRRLHSRRMLGLVDWELLVLFMGLFVVNQALQGTGLPAQAVAWLATAGLDLQAPASLFTASFVLSNLVSNVPAVMLLLPVAATQPQGGTLLALSSTLAGNLFIVGSIANIIVVQAAQQRGIPIGWRRHARVGVPVTLCTQGGGRGQPVGRWVGVLRDAEMTPSLRQDTGLHVAGCVVPASLWESGWWAVRRFWRGLRLRPLPPKVLPQALRLQGQNLLFLGQRRFPGTGLRYCCLMLGEAAEPVLGIRIPRLLFRLDRGGERGKVAVTLGHRAA